MTLSREDGRRAGPRCRSPAPRRRRPGPARRAASASGAPGRPRCGPRQRTSVALAQSGSATDGPGALSHFGLARKDCLGTAPDRTSKVWFTVADGVLSDVYYPTIDNTNVETLQFVVTDGSSFTDLQTRDTTYTVRRSDAVAGWPAG